MLDLLDLSSGLLISSSWFPYLHIFPLREILLTLDLPNYWFDSLLWYQWTWSQKWDGEKYTYSSRSSRARKLWQFFSIWKLVHTHTHLCKTPNSHTQAHTYTLHTSTRGFWVSEGQFCLWDLSPHPRTWLLVPKQFSGESTILRMFSPTWMLAEPLAQVMPSQPDWHSHASKEAGAKGPSHWSSALFKLE